MSAIGDYIHATSLGYHGFGEKRPPYRNSLSIHNLTSQRTENLEKWNANQKINSRVKEELKRNIQSCLDLIKGLQGKQEKDYNEEDKIAVAMLEDIFNSDDFTMSLEKVDKEVLYATNALQGSTGFVAGQQSYYESEKGQKEIENAVIALIQSAEDVLMTATTKDLTKEKIDKKINNLNSQKEIFLNALVFSDYQNSKKNKALQQYTNSYLAELRKLIQTSKKSFNKGTGKQLAKVIQSFISAIKKQNLASNYSGHIGEGIVKIAGAHISALAKTECNKAITSSIIGKNPSQRIISNLSPELDNQELVQLTGKRYTLVQDENLIVTANSAQEKIDVQAYAVGDKKNGFFASVKNYSSEGLTGLTFESKNILSLLDNENKNNLINHYLNLNTIYYTGNDESTWNADKNKINQYIKKILIQKLVSGEGTQIRDSQGRITKMNSANIFIAINSDTFSVKVYNMGDFLTALQKNNKYINQEQLLPELNVIRNPLETYSSAKTRITNILIPLMGSTSITVDINDIKE